MKGNKLELWIASLTTCIFITVQSSRRMLIVNKRCAIFTASIILSGPVLTDSYQVAIFKYPARAST